MDDTYIVTSYCVIEDIMNAYGHQDDSRATISAAEILIVAIVAAKYFQNHHERALCILIKLGDIPPLSVSRFNRRLHALSDWLYGLAGLLGELFTQEEVYVIDSMPMPVCKRVRAWRCKKVRGKAYCGYCAAKKEKFFGWRLHLICTQDGIPVSFDLLPAAYHDLTPIHELAFPLPSLVRTNEENHPLRKHFTNKARMEYKCGWGTQTMLLTQDNSMPFQAF